MALILVHGMVLLIKTHDKLYAGTPNKVSLDITGNNGTVSGINLDCPHTNDRQRRR